jgi:hypothetical protein
MFDGTIKMVQNVKVNDVVMGDDSTERIVLNLSQGVSPMYRVSQINGDDYVVNENHVLSLVVVKTNTDSIPINILGKKYFKNDKIDIPILEYTKLSKNSRDKLKGYKTRVEFYEKKIQTNPYTIGGTLLYIKYIPYIYKCNSRTNRLQLLAGVIDTYGELNICTKNSYEIKFKLTNCRLIKDIKFVIRSLGFLCTSKKNKHKPYYKIHIFGNDLGDIPTKKYKIQNYSKYDENYLYTGIEIKCIGRDNYYGFEVDENHRFLLGDFTVTHNSTLLSDIMYFHKNIPYGTIMSGTEEGNGFYSQYFPDLFIYPEYKSDVLGKLLKQQKIIVKNEQSKSKGHMFLLIDDCMYDKKMIRDKNIRQLFMNGRHWRIMFFLTMQYCMDLPPDLRANLDYIFLLRENVIANQMKLWKNFFGIFPTFKTFQETFLACTENYECLVLDNTSKSNKIEDCVFWYKATPNRRYKIGCTKLWECARLKYNKNYENDEDDNQNLKIVDKKSPGLIITKKAEKYKEKYKNSGKNYKVGKNHKYSSSKIKSSS